MKVKVEATKLKQPRVSFISLVERGANRLPFRILKSDNTENGMPLDLDLMKIFKRAEKAEVKPALLGIVVEKTDQLEQVKKDLTEAGLSVENVEDNEKTVLFRQAEGEIGEAVIIKLSDQSLALITGAQKQEAPVLPLEAVFSEAYAEVAKALQSEDRSGIEGVLKGLTSSIDLYALLPSSVFKADAVLVEKAEAQAKEVKKDESEQAVVTPESNAEGAAEVATETETQKADAQEVAAEVKPEVDVASIVASAVAEGMKSFEGTVAKAIEPLRESITALKVQVGEVDSVAKGLDKRISEVETVAKSTAASVKKTVVASPPADDPGTDKPVKKQDDDPRTGLFDTAFMPKRLSVLKAQKR